MARSRKTARRKTPVRAKNRTRPRKARPPRPNRATARKPTIDELVNDYMARMEVLRACIDVLIQHKDEVDMDEIRELHAALLAIKKQLDDAFGED